MSEYQQVKVGKLRLKGSDNGIKKKKKKKRKLPVDGASVVDKEEVDVDCELHQGWWCAKSYESLPIGNVAIQLFNDRYICANDNGSLSIGSEKEEGSKGPDDEEIFTLIRISETKIALKSGYGKYISVNARGEIYARAEAVGPQEQIDVVIEEEKLAFQGHNGYFFTITVSGNELKAISSSVKEKELIRLRSNASKSKKKKTDEEEQEGIDNLRKCEVGYVKQFQSFGGAHKQLILHQGSTSSLEKAIQRGNFHEVMLNRREKQKADRYCK